MLPVLNLFGLALPLPPLTVIAATWLALDIYAREAERTFGQERAAATWNSAFYALLGGVVGARLFFVVLNSEAYFNAPLNVFARSIDSLSLTGGVLGFLLVGALLLRRNGLLTAQTLDTFAPALLIFLAGIALANLFSGNGYGRETELAWGVTLWGAVRHPTQVYELLGCLGLFAYCWRQRRRSLAHGHLFLMALGGYALLRLSLEYFRADSWLLAGGVRGTQVLALLVLLATVWATKWLRPQHPPDAA